MFTNQKLLLNSGLIFFWTFIAFCFFCLATIFFVDYECLPVWFILLVYVAGLYIISLFFFVRYYFYESGYIAEFPLRFFRKRINRQYHQIEKIIYYPNQIEIVKKGLLNTYVPTQTLNPSEIIKFFSVIKSRGVKIGVKSPNLKDYMLFD